MCVYAVTPGAAAAAPLCGVGGRQQPRWMLSAGATAAAAATRYGLYKWICFVFRSSRRCVESPSIDGVAAGVAATLLLLRSVLAGYSSKEIFSSYLLLDPFGGI